MCEHQIEKIPLSNLIFGSERYHYGYDLPKEVDHIVRNFTPPPPTYRDVGRLILDRDVTLEDVITQKLEKMPGFRFNWYFTGLDEEFNEYSDSSYNKNFVRKLIYIA